MMFKLCYCSICRKTEDGGGYGINLGGDNASLEVEEREHVSVCRSLIDDPRTGDLTLGHEAHLGRRPCRIPLRFAIHAISSAIRVFIARSSRSDAPAADGSSTQHGGSREASTAGPFSAK